MKLSLLAASACLVLGLDSLRAEDLPPERLEEFSQVIFAVHSQQDREAYSQLIHPSCPEIPEWRIEASLKNQWIEGENNDFRFKEVDEVFAPNWVFDVEPVKVIEYQVMTLREDGSQIELTGNYVIANYGDELRVLEYPCLRPEG